MHDESSENYKQNSFNLIKYIYEIYAVVLKISRVLFGKNYIEIQIGIEYPT